jgi:pSer/pThr/pTyr-binding forkhead associated (FHA) protein
MFTLIIEDKHGAIADEYTFEEGEFVIGRSQSADIVLPSDNVSRQHARLYTVERNCYVEDLGSANGVFVNGRRIHEAFHIQRSAQVKVGDYFLHIDSDQGGVEAVEEKVLCKLLGQNLSFAGQVFKINRAVTLIGRGKDCSLTLIDPSVSRVHTKLTCDRQGKVLVEDLSSSNGTFINGQRLDNGEVKHGDMLRIGNAEFVVEVPGHEKAPQAAEEEFDDAWTQPAKNKGLWLTVSLLVAVVVAAGVVFLVFGDRIFGSGTSAAPGGGEGDAATAQVQKAAALASLVSTAEEEVKRVAKLPVAEQKWEDALEAWKKVRDEDPLNSEATRNVNQIMGWQKDLAALSSADSAEKDTKLGEAAKALREIDQESRYYEEAQGRLKKLKDGKAALFTQSDALINEKQDCTGAIELLKQARLIDPQDPEAGDRIRKAEAAITAQKCK